MILTVGMKEILAEHDCGYQGNSTGRTISHQLSNLRHYFLIYGENEARIAGFAPLIKVDT